VALRVQGMPCDSVENAMRWHAANIRPMPNRRSKAEPTTADALKLGADEKPSTVAGKRSRPARTAPSTYQNARTAREVFSAKLAQLDYEQQVGHLVNADEVRAEFAKQIVIVRDKLLRLPDRLVAILLGESDARRMRTLIDAEVRAALAEFHGP